MLNDTDQCHVNDKDQCHVWQANVAIFLIRWLTEALATLNTLLVGVPADPSRNTDYKGPPNLTEVSEEEKTIENSKTS